MTTCCCCGGTVNQIKVNVNVDNRDRAIISPEIESETEIDTKLDTKVDPKIETTVKPKIDTKSDSKSKSKSKAKAKSKSKSKAKAKSQSKSKPTGNDNPSNGETMTICHETPSGQRNTLVLPIAAALKHLEQHPLDTEGPCEEDTTTVNLDNDK